MKKIINTLLLLVMSTIMLTACNGGPKIVIWVGIESVDYYTEVVANYITLYEEKNESKFEYKIEVLAIDTGTAASTFLDDPEAGADIFTVAHDNLGKLIAGSSAIAPIQSEALLTQINNDNPSAFLDVIQGTVGGTKYTFGVPYISQALVLYYNKDLVTSEQVKTWEGMMEAAESVGPTVKALSVTGDDGYNNSFLLLARNSENGETSLKLYPNSVAADSFGTGDDTVAIMKWGQRFFTDPNGAMFPGSDGWETSLANEKVLSVISGAWHYNSAKAALGSKLGIEVIPSFTITEVDAYGTITAGTEFNSGTFADTKMFVMKKNSDKQEILEDILLYLSSVEIQEGSYEKANNLPAYKNAATEFESMASNTLEAALARKQIEMAEFGIAQPFGGDARFNTWYYSKGAPTLIREILENDDNLYITHEQIKAQLEIVQTIWRTGDK